MTKILLVFLLIPLAVNAQIFLPKTKAGIPEEIVQHSAYTLSYNEEHEVANWVAYSLKPDMMQDCSSRQNNFRSDPSISTDSANLEDYKNSGFDRGHLVPAGDMKLSNQLMSESFYLSNMTPQTRKFNGGQWAKLENLFRAWVMLGSESIIISGPILHEGLKVIGESEVSVPKEFFKIILQVVKGRKQMMGFLMPSGTPHKDLTRYIVAVDEIEDRTGIDFFTHLPDDLEEKLESAYALRNFDFDAKFTYLPCRR